MTVELVAGWSEEKLTYLVERSGDDVRIRPVPSRWSMFVQGLDDDDRRSLQRRKEVVALTPGERYTRIDFRGRWARKETALILKDAISAKRLAESGADEVAPRDQQASILEADVSPLRRLLADVGTLQVSPNPRPVWLDIETDSRQKMVDQRLGRARVLSWALDDGKGFQRVEVLEADADAAERDLLLKLYEALRPFDVVLGWSASDFDFPIIQLRADHLRVMPGGRLPIWNRWCWLDHLETFRKYNMHAHESGDEKTSLKLGAIAEKILGAGEGKLGFDATRTWETWEAGGEERARLARYNLQDAALMPRIEAKTGYVALHFAVCHLTRIFPDTRSLHATQMGDGFLLRLGAEHGHRWPTKRDFDDDEPPGQFAGAYVMQPTKTGAIDDVHVCDFAGLYPSIMRTWNMSPDTLLWPRERAASECRLPGDLRQRFRNDRRGMLPLALDQLVSARAEYVRKQDEAETGSAEWEHYKRLSSGIKIVVNSFYGITGSPWSRFYDRDVAEGVTQTGVWLVKQVAATARSRGLDAFYGDTDSIFVQGDRETFTDVVRSCNEFWPRATEGLGCERSHVKLEFEKSFARLLLVGAKTYAGRYSWHKGKPAPATTKVEVKGLAYKRGDTMRMAREMQKEAIDALLAPLETAPGEPARAVELPGADALFDLVARWEERVLRGELSLSDVVLSQSIKSLDDYADRYTSDSCGARLGKGKDARRCGHDFGSKFAVDEHGQEQPNACPRCKTARKLAKQAPHVRVARALAAAGVDVRPGSRIEYLVVGEDESGDTVIPASEDALAKLDRDYYWKRISSPTTDLLEAVYPNRVWVKTAAMKRAEAKEAMLAERRGKIDDLPLFGGEPPAVPPRVVARELPPDVLEGRALGGGEVGYALAVPAGKETLSQRVVAAAAREEIGTALETAKREAAGADPRRRARATPARPSVPPRPEGAGPRCFVTVGEDGEPRGRALLRALRAALEAHAGATPVVLRLRLTTLGATVDVDTGLSVSRSAAARAAIERVSGPGSVEFG